MRLSDQSVPEGTGGTSANTSRKRSAKTLQPRACQLPPGAEAPAQPPAQSNIRRSSKLFSFGHK